MPLEGTKKKTTAVKSADGQDEEKATRNTNKWSQTRRLEFIDYRLAVEGKINRQDLVKYFGISVPQASLDLSCYQDLVSKADPPRENLSYNRHLKVYLRSKDFKPLYPRISKPETYLNDLLLSSRGELIESRNFFGFVPAVGVASFDPVPRKLKFDVLRRLIEAMQTHRAMHIVYMSLNTDSNVDLLVAPHAFAFDGNRWHVRAYCYNRHDFRDYVLSRIVSCAEPNIAAPSDRFPDPNGNGFKEVGTTANDDSDWNETVELKIKVNPELSARERRVIEFDYGIKETGGTLSYTCRKALLFYALRYLKLTRDYDALPPLERLIVLENRDQIETILAKKH
ncbi:MAG: WYL domain-containing protein [Succinivibrio sp.]|nr:WYL domain-containing protein [Succinivibrio sp.]